MEIHPEGRERGGAVFCSSPGRFSVFSRGHARGSWVLWHLNRACARRRAPLELTTSQQTQEGVTSKSNFDLIVPKGFSRRHLEAQVVLPVETPRIDL